MRVQCMNLVGHKYVSCIQVDRDRHCLFLLPTSTEISSILRYAEAKTVAHARRQTGEKIISFIFLNVFVLYLCGCFAEMKHSFITWVYLAAVAACVVAVDNE